MIGAPARKQDQTRRAGVFLVLSSAYRVKTPMIAVMLVEAKECLECLASGSVVVPTSGVDPSGMLTATCDGAFVRVFERDLFERTEPFEPGRIAGAAAD